jgi:hypothetical protein
MLEELQLAAERLLPAHMVEGTMRYLTNGVPMGSFGKAIFSYDLPAARRKADNTNLLSMDNWMEFLVSAAPALSWGSPEAVATWIARGGINGGAEQ